MALVLSGTDGVSGVDGTASNPSYEGTDSNTGIFYPAADTVAIGTGGTERLRVDSSGNVGVGTSTPAYKVAVQQDGNFNATINVSNATAGGSSTSRFLAISDAGNASFGMTSSTYTDITGAQDAMLFNANSASGGIAWALDGTLRMKMDSSGNVGIGTTSTAGYKLVVSDGTTFSVVHAGGGASYYGAISNNPVLFITNNTERVRITSAGDLLVNRTTQFNSEKFGVTFSSNTGAGVVINDSNGQNGNTFIQFRNSGTTAGAITSNGTTTMTYGSASDYRLKENLVPLTGALAKIAALQPKAGNWKADGSEFIGFVAHELQEVFPDSVVGEKDKTDAEGNPEYQMVDTGSAAIIATLTAAIQEQQAMINEMKAEIAALKAQP